MIFKNKYIPLLTLSLLLLSACQKQSFFPNESLRETTDATIPNNCIGIKISDMNESIINLSQNERSQDDEILKNERTIIPVRSYFIVYDKDGKYVRHTVFKDSKTYVNIINNGTSNPSITIPFSIPEGGKVIILVNIDQNVLTQQINVDDVIKNTSFKETFHSKNYPFYGNFFYLNDENIDPSKIGLGIPMATIIENWEYSKTPKTRFSMEKRVAKFELSVGEKGYLENEKTNFIFPTPSGNMNLKDFFGRDALTSNRAKLRWGIFQESRRTQMVGNKNHPSYFDETNYGKEGYLNFGIPQDYKKLIDEKGENYPKKNIENIPEPKLKESHSTMAGRRIYYANPTAIKFEKSFNYIAAQPVIIIKMTTFINENSETVTRYYRIPINPDNIQNYQNGFSNIEANNYYKIQINSVSSIPYEQFSDALNFNNAFNNINDPEEVSKGYNLMSNGLVNMSFPFDAIYINSSPVNTQIDLSKYNANEDEDYAFSIKSDYIDFFHLKFEECTPNLIHLDMKPFIHGKVRSQFTDLFDFKILTYPINKLISEKTKTDKGFTYEWSFNNSGSYSTELIVRKNFMGPDMFDRLVPPNSYASNLNSIQYHLIFKFQNIYFPMTIWVGMPYDIGCLAKPNTGDIMRNFVYFGTKENGPNTRMRVMYSQLSDFRAASLNATSEDYQKNKYVKINFFTTMYVGTPGLDNLFKSRNKNNPNRSKETYLAVGETIVPERVSGVLLDRRILQYYYINPCEIYGTCGF